MSELSPKTIAFLESLFGPLDALDKHEDAVDLNQHPKDTWDEIDGFSVLPTAAIQRYLDSGDTLTNHTVDMMELALEKVYGVEHPWFITSERDGKEEEKNISIRCFFLMKDSSHIPKDRADR